MSADHSKLRSLCVASSRAQVDVRSLIVTSLVMEAHVARY